MIGETLVTNEACVEGLEALFASFGRPFTQNNRRQCAFPKEARILETEVGTAAGFALSKHACEAYFFPGVPSEFRWFVKRHLAAIIKPADDALGHMIRLQFFGLGESQLEDEIEGIEDLAATQGARIGYRAAFPIVE
ncbi:MAG: competence/damage-inducible protein A, partial [Bradymonadaceae bacterium]